MIMNDDLSEHDPEKLQTFPIRSCVETKRYEQEAIQSDLPCSSGNLTGRGVARAIHNTALPDLSIATDELEAPRPLIEHRIDPETGFHFRVRCSSRAIRRPRPGPAADP